jgi:predicted nucleic acid-binding protein
VKIDDALTGVGQLCIETAPFIYYTENRAGYVDKMRAIFQRAVDEHIAIVTSTITLTECLTKPQRDNDTGLITAYKAMLRATHRVRLVSVDDTVAGRAADLRARYNLRTPDALHIATALVTGCDAFLTNDLRLKRVTEIRVLALDELEL